MSDWRKLSLSDVIERFIDYRGKTPQKIDYGVPLVTAKIVKNGKIEEPKEFIAERDYDTWMTRGIPEYGDVVITTEAPMGKVAQLKFKGKVALAQRIITLRGKSDILDNTFLLYSLQSEEVQNQLFLQTTGTTVQGIKASELKKIEILLPPLQEQQKIADILCSVDEAIEKTEAIIEQTKKVKKGLIQHLLTKGIEHKKFKKTEIGEIPAEWELVRVSDLTIEHKQGYYTKDNYVEDGVYLIRITDLKNPKIDFSVMPKLDMDENIYEQFRVDKDDFLFARSGASIGRYGIVMEDDPKAIFASYLIRFKFNNQQVNNRYFGYFYESDVCWKQLKSIIQGSSNPNINANNIKNLKIALPSLDEQKHIVDIIFSVDEKIRINMLMLQEFQTLKSGLMQSLLTGEVRVKVEGNEVTQV
ncbi:restriction endonuclease subunit S [Ectobacillus funiculus]|uniref:Restriction endonuclease subunit S n=1 Tax=Ectobacillus funiculus TaxID=137993 RepID=A0ABV5WIE8_9BACI